MTWLSTWPESDGPKFEAHETEEEAEAHADEIVKSQRARVAAVFRANPEEPR